MLSIHPVVCNVGFMTGIDYYDVHLHPRCMQCRFYVFFFFLQNELKRKKCTYVGGGAFNGRLRRHYCCWFPVAFVRFSPTLPISIRDKDNAELGKVKQIDGQSQLCHVADSLRFYVIEASVRPFKHEYENTLLSPHSLILTHSGLRLGSHTVNQSMK